MFRTLAWFVWFPWFFPFIENQRIQVNQTDMGGMAVGTTGSGRDRGQ